MVRYPFDRWIHFTELNECNIGTVQLDAERPPRLSFRNTIGISASLISMDTRASPVVQGEFNAKLKNAIIARLYLRGHRQEACEAVLAVGGVSKVLQLRGSLSLGQFVKRVSQRCGRGTAANDGCRDPAVVVMEPQDAN